MAVTASELTWSSSQLHDVSLFLPSPPVLFCDNLNAFYYTTNPIFHAQRNTGGA